MKKIYSVVAVLLLCLVGTAIAQDLGTELSRLQTRVNSVKELIKLSEGVFAEFRATQDFKENFAQYERGTFGSPFSFDDAKLSYGQAEIAFHKAQALFGLKDSTEYAEVSDQIRRANEHLNSALYFANRPMRYIDELRIAMASGQSILDSMQTKLDSIYANVRRVERALSAIPDSSLYKGTGPEDYRRPFPKLLGRQRQAETYFHLAETAFNSRDYDDFVKYRKRFEETYKEFMGHNILNLLRKE